MYLICMPMMMQAVPEKQQVEELIGKVLQLGIPVGQTPEGQIQALKVTKEQIKVFDISSLEVDINKFDIKQPSSILRATGPINAK